MITANELRIGNWVMYNDQNETPMPTAIQICIQDLILINENVKDCNYNPILLTEEILLKCGFRKLDKYTFVNRLFIHKRKAGFIINLGKKKILISFIHELQNLYYALTKNELIINL